MSQGQQSSASRLIVHADDFGETVEITRGIAECIEAGAVTSTSILANMPGTAYALQEALRLRERASFGVHLNFCEGAPLTAGRTLVGSGGAFLPKRALARRALLGGLADAEVAAEAAAQIEAVRSAGVRISHVDSHKHLHQLPGLRDAVARVTRSFGIERIRCTIEDGPLSRAATRPSVALSRFVRIRLAKHFRPRAARLGLRMPDRVVDVSELIAQRTPAERRAVVRRPGAITEMFCHPGTHEADREKPGSCSRWDESQYLRSPEFRATLRDAEVDLVTYWEV